MRAPVELLRKHLSYDPETGFVQWITTGSGRKTGVNAGKLSVNNDGMWTCTIQFMNRKYSYAVIAWALHYGEYAKGNIFSESGVKNDFRICNLTTVRTYKSGPERQERATDDQLKEVFRYDPETGVITKTVCGEEYLCEKSSIFNGIEYLTVCYRGKQYLSHRLAWLLHTGLWPEKSIDHRNRIGTDNRFANLRDVSHLVNMRNKKLDKRNKSGYRGVTWNEKMQKWHVQFCVDGKTKHIGFYTDLEEGAAVRKQLEEKHWK